MVLDTVTVFTYFPLAADGFARMMLSMNAFGFSQSWSGEKKIFPNGRVPFAGLVKPELHLARL